MTRECGSPCSFPKSTLIKAKTSLSVTSKYITPKDSQNLYRDLINTYKELNTWFQIRENALTAWGYILFWMSYRKIYLNEFSANDLDWNLNIEGTLNYARQSLIYGVLPVK